MPRIRRYPRLRTGPVLIDIYSSEFARMCSYDESMLYADDTVLVYVEQILESTLIRLTID